jgi:hypothetical protein
MNPLAKIAVDLKKAGFPQDLNYRDSVYIPRTQEYLNPIQLQEGFEYVRVPNTVSLFSAIEDFDYNLECLFNPKAKQRAYKLTASEIVPIEDISLWAVVAKFWLIKKGQ